MTGIKLQKRDKDFFVSYGHADRGDVIPLLGWLHKICGLKIWFDDHQGNAAKRSSELLADGIGNARGALFLLSNGWTNSSWCRDEFEVALSERRANEGFEVVAVRLDDVSLPAWFTIAETLDLTSTDFKPRARLLCSLASDVPHRFDNDQDVYVAAPWSRSSPLTAAAMANLHSMGWRLVGDAPNLKHLGESRIESIMRTTRGVVAILPHDGSQAPHATSPYILEEAELALGCGKPLLLLTEPGVTLPDALVSDAFCGSCTELSADASGREKLSSLLDAFDEHLARQQHDDTGAFIFIASSLRGDPAEADEIDRVVERASNMRCVRGERLSGDNVQQAIIDVIRRAAVVIADVSDDNRNTLIETGVAMGCGTRLKLIARTPDAMPPKKRFMFEGQEFFWYGTPEERLGLCFWIARQFRRRIYVER